VTGGGGINQSHVSVAGINAGFKYAGRHRRQLCNRHDQNQRGHGGEANHDHTAPKITLHLVSFRAKRPVEQDWIF
jgi:hypothetical protein